LVLARVVLHERSVPVEGPALDLEIAPQLVPPLDRRAQAASEACFLVQVDPGLTGNRAIELRPTDDAAVDQDLAELLAAPRLSQQRIVELATLDSALVHEYRPQQGPDAAVPVHVLPSPVLLRLQSKNAPGRSGAKSLVQGFVTSSPSSSVQVQTVQ